MWYEIVIILLVVLLLLAAGGLGAAGIYFYNIAINADGDKRMIFGERAVTKIEDETLKRVKGAQNGANSVWNTSWDGLKLHALTVEGESDVWVIAVHGYMGCGSELWETAKHFAAMGYHVLLPDLRGHGESEGGYIGMGAPDRRDILSWISWILKREPEARIVLYGVSMGASTVLLTTGEHLPENVIAAVEDCGYTSAWEEFAYQLRERFYLPAFPFLQVSALVTRLRAGYWFWEADALKAVRHSATPTLFLHGEADTFVPFEMVRRLYAAAACEKELVTFPEAGHAQSECAAPERYWSVVEHFLKAHL